jgi:hypothetical protein
METVRNCSQCDKTFRDAEGRRKKCHACRQRKVPCKSERCHRYVYAGSRHSGYCKSCLNMLELNPNWRGGRIRHQQGYIMLRQPDGSYIFEHRIVMEQVLNRPLEPYENVHHKNGVRHDNRPENLELWTTYQPRGQRVSDLVQWARQILQQYDEA